MNRRRLSLLGYILLLCFASIAGAAPTTAPLSAELSAQPLAAGAKAMLAVVIDVPPGLHAQSHTPLDPNYIALTVTPEANSAIAWSDPIYPPGENKTFGVLGTLSVYTGRTIVLVPLQVKSDAAPGGVELHATVRYQMCNDTSCFAPQSPVVSVNAQIAAAGTKTKANNPELFKVAASASRTQATTTASSMTSGAPSANANKKPWTVWTALGAALIAGLLFNIMPCVLPVLPLKAVGFYEASQHNRGKSFALGIVFSIGLISVFAVLAIFVLVLRLVSWGDLFTHGWFVWTIVVILIALSLGLIGAWNVALPMGIYRFEPRHDTFGGNFFWGVLTAVLATPCTAPLLPPVMTWAAAQTAVLGVLVMLVVGFGMALPYLLLSATPELARKFPRAGPWAELFKQEMGFLLLAAAAFFAAGRLIAGPGFWWVVVAVVTVASLYLIARTVQLSKEMRPLMVSIILGVAMMGGVLWWTAKVTGIGSSSGAVADTWQPFDANQFKSLQDAGKPVLVKFTANWCGSCQYIEGTVFRDPRVWNALKSDGFTTMKADFSTDADAPGKKLLLQLNPAGGIPVTAIFTGAAEPKVFNSVYTSNELLEAIHEK